MSIPVMGEPSTAPLPLNEIVVVDSLASQTVQFSSTPLSTGTVVAKNHGLIPLLSLLTATDNHTRNAAEHSFNGLKESQPEALVYGLLEVGKVAT